MKRDTLKCYWVRKTFGWHQKPSGYDELCDYLIHLPGIKAQSFESNAKEKIPSLITNSLMGWFNRSRNYGRHDLDTEIRMLLASLTGKPDLIHFFYCESSFSLWSSKYIGHGIKRVATAHQPESWWKLHHKQHDNLKGLDALIVMSSAMKNFFETIIPGKVFLRRHSVDTVFFKPDELTETVRRTEAPRFVFSGFWMRDFRTLEKIMEEVLRRNKNVFFDLVIPGEGLQQAGLESFSGHPQVVFHRDISAEALRDVYCRGEALLIPLTDAGANNAVVEALSCGLPLISTRVGGVPDYAEPEFAELYDSGDWQSMTAAVLRAAENREEYARKRIQARLFAERNLTMEQAAAETVEIYRQVVSVT